MKLRSGFALFVFSISVILMGGFAQSSSAKPIELSYVNMFPPQHFHGILAQEYIDTIEKRTDGRVKIVFYPGGSLVPGHKTFGALKDGIADIGLSVIGYSRGVFPALEAVDLPMGYKSASQATRIINEFYKKFKPKELDDIKVLLLNAHGPGLIHSKKPIRTLEDIRGVKVRCYGFSVKVIDALGGVPVAMPQNEAYEALQKGVCDATLVPVEALKGWKQAEVIKYTTEVFSIGYTSGLFLFMNKDKWADLPADIQAIFDQTSQEFIPKYGAAWEKADQDGRAFTLELGNEIIPMSDEEQARWAAVVRPVIDEWVKDAAKKGLPAKEYVDWLTEAVKIY